MYNNYNNSAKYRDMIEKKIMKKKRYAEDNVPPYDKEYWSKNGWLDTNCRYYYDTRAGLIEKAAASIFIKILIPFLNI